MPYTNIKTLLVDATKLPAAVEAKLPAGAPKISTMLVDAAGRIPVVPDFPMAIPDLPAIPAMPEFPGGAGLRRYVTGVEIIPVQQRQAVVSSPTVGVLPEVITRRGL